MRSQKDPELYQTLFRPYLATDSSGAKIKHVHMFFHVREARAIVCPAH